MTTPEMENLRNEIEAACLAVLPEIPVYLVWKSEVPSGLRIDGAGGWASQDNDVFLPCLDSRRQGRRPVICLTDPPNERTMWQTVCHELGHVLAGKKPPTVFRPEMVAALRVEDATAPPVILEPNSDQDGISWRQHEVPWIRAAIHCGFRMGYGGTIPQIYGLSSEFHYLRALGDEPESLSHLSLTTVMATPPPSAFVELWQSDIRRWFLGLKNPTDSQVTALCDGLKLFVPF